MSICRRGASPSSTATMRRARPVRRIRAVRNLCIWGSSLSIVAAAAAHVLLLGAAPPRALALVVPSSSAVVVPPGGAYAAFRRPPLHRSKSKPSSALRSSPSPHDESSSSSSSPPPPPPPPPARRSLRVGIVGAGPSGLLLAHRILSSPSFSASVTVFESRPDPRDPSTGEAFIEGRAYALGLNGRSRSAIRSVPGGGGGPLLWEEVKSRGFESDKFVLRVGPKFKLKLRDGTPRLPRGFRDKDEPPPEPSVLIYQSDLCAALLDKLEENHGGDGGKLTLRFGQRVTGVDVDSNFVRIDDGGEGTILGAYDLLAGCGGVNSPVRTGILYSAPEGTFECETRALPGTFKVARLPNMPPRLDPDAVTLLIPGGDKKDKKKKKKKAGPSPTTAFVEPVRDGGACILFAGGRGATDIDGSESEQDGEGTSEADANADVEEIDPLLSPPRVIEAGDRGSLALDLARRFPLITDGLSREDLDAMVTQLLTQGPSRASSVRCNAYHYRSAVLCGDAAHATGGVSGQGVNSAFVDSKVLADCLDEAFAEAGGKAGGSSATSSGGGGDSTRETVRSALLAYSQRQVPEGWALYDLSFGAEGELSVLTKLRALLANARDTVFGGKFGIGKPVLQVQLSSTLRSFADIRRGRDKYYGEIFPDQEDWARIITETYHVENDQT